MGVARFTEIWGAHACSVLVVASCDDELRKRLFRQNAETSTLQACAPQNLRSTTN